MPKNKGKRDRLVSVLKNTSHSMSAVFALGAHTSCRWYALSLKIMLFIAICLIYTGKGGKNRRRGKNESDEKRELIFKEDGQGRCDVCFLRKYVFER